MNTHCDIFFRYKNLVNYMLQFLDISSVSLLSSSKKFFKQICTIEINHRNDSELFYAEFVNPCSILHTAQCILYKVNEISNGSNYWPRINKRASHLRFVTTLKQLSHMKK